MGLNRANTAVGKPPPRPIHLSPRRYISRTKSVPQTAEGKRAADSPSERYYDAKRKPKVVVPANWLDTSIGKKGHRAAGPANIPGIWPYGGSALAADGQYCVAVWQRYHPGGPTGIDMVKGDIQAGRVDGWKALDKDGVVVADSAASERYPALAGNGAGKLLCVYE